MNDFEMLEEARKISFCLILKTFLSWAFAYLANLFHEPFPEMQKEHFYLDLSWLKNLNSVLLSFLPSFFLFVSPTASDTVSYLSVVDVDRGELRD